MGAAGIENQHQIQPRRGKHRLVRRRRKKHRHLNGIAVVDQDATVRRRYAGLPCLHAVHPRCLFAAPSATCCHSPLRPHPAAAQPPRPPNGYRLHACANCWNVRCITN
uniref:Uncharacterized protein n=1 Tax=Oryza barthii TaxID=65489 RepID=A0A0D3F1T1_9ORYZ